MKHESVTCTNARTAEYAVADSKLDRQTNGIQTGGADGLLGGKLLHISDDSIKLNCNLSLKSRTLLYSTARYRLLKSMSIDATRETHAQTQNEPSRKRLQRDLYRANEL